MRKAELGLLEVDKEKAEAEYRNYLKACRNQSYPHFQKMKKVYFQLKKGLQVIDVEQAMKRAGLNEKGEPILAIARADMKTVFFVNRCNERKFCERIGRSQWNPRYHTVFAINHSFENKVKRETLQTEVPPIPPEHLPKGKAQNYHILFEVKDWNQITTDPILLKHITGSLYAVLAKWDLSKVEQMVLRGG